MTTAGEKIIIRLLVAAVGMLVGMRWEKNGGNFTVAEKAIKDAEDHLRHG